MHHSESIKGLLPALSAAIADMADRVMRMADGRIVDTHANAHKVAAATLHL